MANLTIEMEYCVWILAQNFCIFLILIGLGFFLNFSFLKFEVFFAIPYFLVILLVIALHQNEINLSSFSFGFCTKKGNKTGFTFCTTKWKTFLCCVFFFISFYQFKPIFKRNIFFVFLLIQWNNIRNVSYEFLKQHSFRFELNRDLKKI